MPKEFVRVDFLNGNLSLKINPFSSPDRFTMKNGLLKGQRHAIYPSNLFLPVGKTIPFSWTQKNLVQKSKETGPTYTLQHSR